MIGTTVSQHDAEVSPLVFLHLNIKYLSPVPLDVNGCIQKRDGQIRSGPCHTSLGPSGFETANGAGA